MASRTKPVSVAVPMAAVVAVIGTIMVLIGWAGWQAMTATEREVGPRKEVRPGMYDLRAEVRKMQESRGQGATPDSK